MIGLGSMMVLLLVGRPAHAQQEQYRWRAGAYLGSMLYYGDLNRRLVPETTNPDRPAFGISVERLLNKTWSGKLLYTQGQWIANDRAHDTFLARSLNAKTEVQDYSLLFTYYLDNNRQLGRRSFLAPYFSFGLGYTSFAVLGDLRDSNGAYYHYWSDYTIRSAAENDPGAGSATVVTPDGTYETNLSSLETERSYPAESFNLPVALGLKFRLSSNINLNVELLMRYAFTDYLDDVSGNYRTEYTSAEQGQAANPTAREGTQRGSSPHVNDFYAFPSVSLHYSFAPRRTAYRAPKLYAVAGQVDSYALPPGKKRLVTDTLATLEVARTLDPEQRYALSDSLSVVPHIVGQDTLLAVLQSRPDSLFRSAVPLSRVTLSPVGSDLTLSPDTLLRLSDSRAAVVSQDSLTRDTLVSIVRVDTLALIDPTRLSVSDSLASSDSSPEITRSLIPLSDDRALRVQPDSSGTQLRLVEYQPVPAVTSVPSFGSFDPRPDSLATRPVAKTDSTTTGSELGDAASPSSQKPTPQPRALPADTATAESSPTTWVASPENQERQNAITSPPPNSVAVVPTNEPGTAPPSQIQPATSATGGQADRTLPVGVGIAVTPTSSPATADTATLDSSYVATLSARMDTFSDYLGQVNQKNDTSFASLLAEVKQLQQQLDNLQNASQPAVQAATIAQKLRTLKLRELGTTDVFFGYASATVSAVGTERLQQVALLVKNAPDVLVRLRGFTDTTGDPERNQLLSRRRAEAVQVILVKAGVTEDRISAGFFGADRTLSKNEASYGRRVEVVLEE